ncbi:MAG: TVP38/TMEM64 family protein, partial [Myxococcales bacterium]|nr:TVP38/TMEM64 family protein [Myxococcales bacterium]
MAKLALVVAAGTLVIAAWQLGWFGLIANPQLLRERILGIGSWGYVVFLLGFFFLAPFGLPGILFVLASAYIWPRPIAYGLSLAGAVGSSAVGFAFARFVAHDFVDKRLPPRIRKYDPWIQKRGWIAAAVLRAIFLMHPLLHAAFGLSRIRFFPYIAGSTLGYVPSLAVVVWVSG